MFCRYVWPLTSESFVAERSRVQPVALPIGSEKVWSGNPIALSAHLSNWGPLRNAIALCTCTAPRLYCSPFFWVTVTSGRQDVDMGGNRDRYGSKLQTGYMTRT
jgi:hypothetical protein